MNNLYKLFLLLTVALFVGLNVEAKITGKVSDSKTNEPIIGANVFIKGTTIGTTTDINGDYSINVSDTNTVLVITYVGYNQIEIRTGNRNEINIALESKVEELDQVVVIGYGTTKKADVVGAISSVNSKEINSLMTTNVTQAIQGRAAGVEVINTSGAPGAEVRIKIRGTGTLKNSDPLYVVDGFIVDDIKSVNPEDIKDFQILKDASSSAIYGARAANGVVLITTKRGEKGGVNILFSSNFSNSELWRMPTRTNKEQFKQLVVASYGDTKKTWNDIITGNDLAFYEMGVENWMDYIYSKSFGQKYNLQVSGGNENNSFLVSGTVADDLGTIMTSHNSKRTFRLNMDNKLNRFLTLKSNVTIYSGNVRKIDENGVFSAVMSSNPFSTYYDKNYMFFNGDSVVKNFNVVSGNVYSDLKRHNNTEKENRNSANIDLETKITNNLVNNTRIGYDLNFFESNDFWGTNGNLSQYKNGDMGSISSAEKRKEYKWQAEDILRFSTAISENHNILFLTGLSLEGFNKNFMKGGKSGAVGVDDAANSFNGTYSNVWLEGASEGWTSMGIPMRFDYNYAHKYFFQLNCRADASSQFTPENRWGFFPSVSIGWTITEENFMAGTKGWLTQLKLRGNWGKSGNNRIDTYSAYTMISTNSSNTAIFGYNPTYQLGWAPGLYGNPRISWEKTTGSGAGIDWSLFQGSISGSFDIFKKSTTDMLLQLPLQLSFGSSQDWKSQYITPWQNAGSVDNTGYEVLLSYKKTIKDFSFEISGNFSQIRNKVVKLGEQGYPVFGAYYDANGIKQTYLTYSAVGQPIGMFYGWKIDKTKPGHANGIWKLSDTYDGTNKSPVRANAGALPEGGTYAGDFIFSDLNGDGKINEQDKTNLGSPFPKCTYGFNLNIQYKGIELTAFFQGVYGNKILNLMRYYSYAFHNDVNNKQSGNSTAPDLLARSYTPANEDAEFPMIKYGLDNNFNYRVSDFYIEDGSYFRLKNLQLGYSIPKRWIEKAKIRSLRLSVGATNLFTITNYSGFDPEIGGDNFSFGVDKGTYPQSRSYLGSITVEF